MPDLHLPFSELLPLEPDYAKLDESERKQLLLDRKNKRAQRRQRREKRVTMDAGSTLSNSFLNEGANSNAASGVGVRQSRMVSNQSPI